jgi:hypothetical protein
VSTAQELSFQLNELNQLFGELEKTLKAS